MVVRGDILDVVLTFGGAMVSGGYTNKGVVVFLTLRWIVW